MSFLTGVKSRPGGDPPEDALAGRGICAPGTFVALFQAAAILGFAAFVGGILWYDAMDLGEVGAPDSRVRVRDGEAFRPQGLETRQPAAAIGRPDRVKRLLRPGTSYHILLKGGFATTATDLDYPLSGLSGQVGLVFAFEVSATRTVESNDGRRIVEVLDFHRAVAVKLLADVDEMRLELGDPGTGLLKGIHRAVCRRGDSSLPVELVAGAILGEGGTAVSEDPAAKALGALEPLSGKRVRLTYLDGSGVLAVEPIGCALSAADCEFLLLWPALADSYSLPEMEIAPGLAWSVDAGQLGRFLDPSFRWAPSGDVLVQRTGTVRRGGKRYAVLRIHGRDLLLVPLFPWRHCQSRFTPTGTLWCSLEDGLVEVATLEGPLKLSIPGHDHLLTGVLFSTTARLRVSYCCKAG